MTLTFDLQALTLKHSQQCPLNIYGISFTEICSLSKEIYRVTHAKCV